MSQRVVGYEGEGRSRRRIVVDEGPATAAARHPMAMVERGGMPRREITAPTGGAGAIERRQLYEAEDDVRAAAAREARIHAPTSVKAATSQVSRQRGADANRARVAALRAATPPEEDPAMDDVLPTSPEMDKADAVLEEPDLGPFEPLSVEDALARLITRAEIAASAWAAKEDAEEALDAANGAWATAVEALDAAWTGIPAGRTSSFTEHVAGAYAEPPRDTDGSELPTPGVNEPPVSEPGADYSDPIPAPTRPADPPPADLSRLTAHQARVLDATVRLRGDRKAVAEELHIMREGVDVTLEAVGKKGCLPVEIIPLLPARFARYATVAGS